MPRNSTGKTVRDFYFLHEMLDGEQNTKLSDNDVTQLWFLLLQTF